MNDIFISYSRRDSEHAISLAERLRASGANVWMDTSSLTAAETWSAEIVAAIRSCHTLIVLLSPASVASKNVMKEVGLASEREKRIVPIILEQCELGDALEYALAGLQRVNISDHEAMGRVYGKLGGGVAELPKPPVDQTADPFSPDLIRIAVLPFEDQSHAHDNEWFSDGLTDELILTLNKLDALFVLDRKSSQLYKDARISVKQIAAELDVRYIITGAVRKAGQNIRVQASLVEASAGATIWDEKFSGTMDDIFEIQEKTAFDIAEGLKLQLTPAETLMLEERLTSSAEAYRLILRARERGNRFQDMAGGLEHLTHAIRIDPQFITAYSMISIVYANQYRASNPRDHTLLELSKQAMEHIKLIDPKSAFYYGPRANYYLNINENELALDMATKLVELRPKHFVSYAVLGFIHDALGNYRESMHAFQRAVELDPATASHYVKLALAAIRVGEKDLIAWCWEKGRPLYERAIAAHPESIQQKIEFMNLAMFAGADDVSVQFAEEIDLVPDLPLEVHAQCAAAWMRVGQIERGTKALQHAIDNGLVAFEGMDRDLFRAIEGTPTYQFVIDHIVRP
jgi:TolB-like protein/Flp pilus assembly protein TadD